MTTMRDMRALQTRLFTTWRRSLSRSTRGQSIPKALPWLWPILVLHDMVEPSCAWSRKLQGWDRHWKVDPCLLIWPTTCTPLFTSAGCHVAVRLTLSCVESTLMRTTYSTTADTGLTCHASCRGRVVYLDANYGRRHTCSPPCAYACQDFAVRRMARVNWLGKR